MVSGKLKSLFYIAAIIAGSAAIAAFVFFFVLPVSNGATVIGAPSIQKQTYSSGNFEVHVLEDSANRFLAHVENKGPSLTHAAAFLVKKGLNDDCEPRGIVLANFQVTKQEGTSDGSALPRPDSLPGQSSVIIDSRQSNINNIPTGPGFETTVYVLKLKPKSIQAETLIQKIPVQRQHPNSTDLQLFEECLQRTGKGYPLVLKVDNLQKGAKAYFTIAQDNDTASSYQTSLSVQADAPNNNNNNNTRYYQSVFWPPSREGWLADNFTKVSGATPAWKEPPKSVTVSVKVVSNNDNNELQQGQTSYLQFEKTLRLSGLRTYSVDFIDVARGTPVPNYPKFWEIDVDMQSHQIH